MPFRENKKANQTLTQPTRLFASTTPYRLDYAIAPGPRRSTTQGMGSTSQEHPPQPSSPGDAMPRQKKQPSFPTPGAKAVPAHDSSARPLRYSTDLPSDSEGEEGSPEPLSQAPAEEKPPRGQDNSCLVTPTGRRVRGAGRSAAPS